MEPRKPIQKPMKLAASRRELAVRELRQGLADDERVENADEL